MQWMDTWVSMANSALSRINNEVIETLDDASTSAMLCRQLLPQCTKAILARNDWKCARKRARIAPLLETPAFGYSHKFQMPSDYVRLVKIESDEAWEREGTMILSNADSLKIIYIAYPSTPDSLDSLVVDAITTMLAAELSITLCTDSTLTNLLYQEAEVKIQNARLQEQAGENDDIVEMNDLSAEFKHINRDDNISPLVR